jgi:hypothetical protein
MESCSALINQTSQQWHQFVVEKISWGFLSTRAAENVAREGYPWQGVTMLRNVHDRFIPSISVLAGASRVPDGNGHL